MDDDLVVRARAAGLLVDEAVVGGYAAAAIHGADCAPRHVAVDLVVGRRRIRTRPGLRVRQDELRDDEVVEVDGLRVTSPERTAYDLVRASGFVEVSSPSTPSRASASSSPRRCSSTWGLADGHAGIVDSLPLSRPPTRVPRARPRRACGST